MIERLGEPPRAKWPAIVALLICAALWSLNGPLIKQLAATGVPGVTIACYRSLLGGLVFAAFAWRGRRTLRRVSAWWPIVSLTAFTVMTAAFVIATTRTAAANAIILQYTSPVWVFALSPWLLNERPGRTEGLVLLVVMAGVAIIFCGNPVTDRAGLLIALLSGLGYGTLTVMLRGLWPVSPPVVAAINTLGSGLILIAAVAWSGRFSLRGNEWTYMILLALVQFTLPYVLFSWALQRIEAYKASLIVLLETVLNPLFTFIIVGEIPPAATLLGGPVILFGVAGWIVLVWHRDRAGRRAVGTAPT